MDTPARAATSSSLGILDFSFMAACLPPWCLRPGDAICASACNVCYPRNDELDFDPLEPEDFDSPYVDCAAACARECPVAHSDAWGGFWALMKHQRRGRGCRRQPTFITSKQNVVPKVAFTGRRPPLHLDPPEHTPVPARAGAAADREARGALRARDPRDLPRAAGAHGAPGAAATSARSSPRACRSAYSHTG